MACNLALWYIWIFKSGFLVLRFRDQVGDLVGGFSLVTKWWVHTHFCVPSSGILYCFVHIPHPHPRVISSLYNKDPSFITWGSNFWYQTRTSGFILLIWIELEHRSQHWQDFKEDCLVEWCPNDALHKSVKLEWLCSSRYKHIHCNHNLLSCRFNPVLFICNSSDVLQFSASKKWDLVSHPPFPKKSKIQSCFFHQPPPPPPMLFHSWLVLKGILFLNKVVPLSHCGK